ncbi:MAG TPA: major capsid protein [Blastocatellia bacterium]|nr:major capsid protein [Blastocatellia bacterium]
MAIGTATDFKIYPDQFFGGMVETLEQNVDAFNQASGGALRLITQRKKGHFEQESFIKKLSGLISRRDISSTAAVADNKLAQDEIVGVKINRRIGPVAETMDAFRKIQVPPDQFSFLLGQQIGPEIAADFVNTGLLALEAALENVAGVFYDHSGVGAGTITQSGLVNGLAKFGDASTRVKAWVMHSKPYFDLMQDLITNKLYENTGIVVFEGSVATLNRPTIVIDSPSLLKTGTPNTYRILGLVDGAMEVAESEERSVVSDTITGQENLVVRIQGEHAYNLKLKGFKWDTAGGGVNPTDAALSTGANWINVMADVKSLGGIVIKCK